MTKIEEERARVARVGVLYRQHEEALIQKYGRSGWLAIWPETGTCVWAERAEDLCDWFASENPPPVLCPCGRVPSPAHPLKA